MKLLTTIGVFLTHAILLGQSGSGNIAGHIRGIDGQAAAGVRVALVSPESDDRILAITTVETTTTDASGNYRFEKVRPGRYGIVAGAVISPTYYPGTADAARARIVVSSPGSAIEDLNFKLVSPGNVKLPPANLDPDALFPYLSRVTGIPISVVQGRVVSEKGTLPRSLMDSIRVAFSSDKVSGSVSVSSSGTFRAGLNLADYAVSVVDADGNPLDGYVVKSITLGSGDLLKEMLKLDGPVPGEIVVTVTPVP